VPVLKRVNQLMGEGLPLLVWWKPVGQHHDLVDGIVVGRGLLQDQVGQEAAEIEVRRDEPPGNERAPLGVQTRRRVLPGQLAGDELATLVARSHHDTRRSPRHREPAKPRELLEDAGSFRPELGRHDRLGRRR
jgi:hypothetical protein